MDGMTFVLLVVALGCGVGVYAIWTGYQEKKLRYRATAGAEDEVFVTIARMEERIEVLEKIVTDSGRSVADEIERLEREGRA